MHHRQSNQSNHENNESSELAVLRQARINRMRTVIAGASAIAFSMFAIACPQPADLENPPPPASTGGTGTGGSGTTTAGQSPTGGTGGGGGPVCESACIEALFTKGTKCVICHYKNAPPDAPSLGSLDLSVGYTARLKDVAAKHTDGMPDLATGIEKPLTSGCPSGDMLINTQNPGESWLWKKVSGGHGTCGTAMPQPPATLTATETMCVKSYVECVAGGKTIGAGSGGSGTGGSGTGGGGTGGTGTGGSGGAAGGTTGGGGGTGGT